YRPDVVCVERVFAQHNVRTVMGTAQASGVVMAAGARRSLPVALHTPSEVKAAVTGSGRADKAQVGSMVARILGLDAAPRPADAADAVALAICHLWRAAAAGRLTELQAASTRAGDLHRPQAANGYARAVAAARRAPVSRTTGGQR